MSSFPAQSSRGLQSPRKKLFDAQKQGLFVKRKKLLHGMLLRLAVALRPPFSVCHCHSCRAETACNGRLRRREKRLSLWHHRHQCRARDPVMQKPTEIIVLVGVNRAVLVTLSIQSAHRHDYTKIRPGQQPRRCQHLNWYCRCRRCRDKNLIGKKLKLLNTAFVEWIHRIHTITAAKGHLPTTARYYRRGHV